MLTLEKIEAGADDLNAARVDAIVKIFSCFSMYFYHPYNYFIYVLSSKFYLYKVHDWYSLSLLNEGSCKTNIYNLIRGTRETNSYRFKWKSWCSYL